MTKPKSLCPTLCILNLIVHFLTSPVFIHNSSNFELFQTYFKQKFDEYKLINSDEQKQLNFDYFKKCVETLAQKVAFSMVYCIVSMVYCIKFYIQLFIQHIVATEKYK